jgi:hypothetical protein
LETQNSIATGHMPSPSFADSRSTNLSISMLMLKERVDSLKSWVNLKTEDNAEVCLGIWQM